MRTFEVNGIEYRLTYDINRHPGSWTASLTKVKISTTDPNVYRKYLYFEFHYWGFRSCGCIHLAGLNQCGSEVDPDMLEKVFSSWDDIFESEHEYIKAQQFMFMVSDPQKSVFVEWLKSRENCRPVHTYRNQAHEPFTQMTLYAWHPKGLGLPDKWGMDEVPKLGV